MKNSKFSFKRAMALVICLCMVVSSLVFAPVVSAETEITNTNTQEYQYYDIDNTEFSEGSKYERASLKEDDGTGNNALRLTKNTSGATAVYGQLDHALEAGKEYTVSFYVKGKSMFVVSFTDSPIYDQITKAQYISGKSEKPYNNEEYTKVTLGPVTIPDDATYNTVRFMGYKVDAGSEFDSAVCYIDNITIVENTNTQEYQKYDFDYINPTEKLNESKLYSKFTEDDDNVAIHASTISGTKGYYMGLDHSLEIGKKYKIAFDLKGECKAWIGLAIDTTWNTVIGVPDSSGDSYNSPDAYEHYEYEMKAATAEYNTIVFFAQTGTTDFYFDNIVISEECAVTVGAAENGTATLDKTSYYYGDTATLIATPDAGYVFAGWVDAEGNAVADTMKYTFEVAASVTLTPVFEKAEANTAEYQKYDLDGLTFTDENIETEGKASVADDGTGNKAIKIEKYNGASHFYAQPEFAFKSGKRYIISMDVKGVNRFWFGLSSNCGYVAGMSTLGLPDKKEKTYTNDEYTTITFDTGVLTTDIYNSIYFCSFANADLSGSVGYIDNIVIEEYPFTQEKQGFDFDEYSPVNPYNENPSGFSVVTEEDGNKALKVTTPANGTKGYYMQLDFPVEKGKKYKVAFDYKGEEGSFWVGLFDKLNWGTKRIKFPNGGHYFEAKEEYTHYELELTSDTDLEYICLAIMAQKHSSVEAGTVYYIDNIVLTEEVDVTVGTAENGKTSVDGKAIFYGDSVDLTALPNPAYKFVKWIDDNGAEVSFANPYSFVAKEAFNITPVFEAYEATEYVRDFDNEEYNNMAPIVGNNSASVEYVYNGDIKKTVAKITIKNDNGKIAIPFVPKDGKDYRVKITYLYTKWFCLFYNGAVQGGEGPSGDAGKWLTKDWYYTQSGNDLFYLFTTKLATNAPAGEPCTIFIDSISFIESTKGDLNNDDAMDSLDITLLRKFLMGDNENDIDLSAANVSQINDDDKIEVDVKDLVALKKKIVSNK